jgi:hypothetical protein
MFEKIINKSTSFIHYFLNQIELTKQIIIGILFLISLYYILKILKRIYLFLFKYTDILNFNEKIKNYYSNNIVNFIEKNKKQKNIKTRENNDLNEIKKIESKYKKNERTT